MNLSELENQLLELFDIKIKAVKEKRYEEAARARDKESSLIARFKATFNNLNKDELLEAENFLARWTSQ
ncbi:MAG: hypothetical protein H7250_12625 [Flavobacterium sp.]|nr:hypothetical protein [Flavobacterium sp.]